jgi:hypothetical protein
LAKFGRSSSSQTLSGCRNFPCPRHGHRRCPTATSSHLCRVPLTSVTIARHGLIPYLSPSPRPQRRLGFGSARPRPAALLPSCLGPQPRPLSLSGCPHALTTSQGASICAPRRGPSVRSGYLLRHRRLLSDFLSPPPYSSYLHDHHSPWPRPPPPPFPRPRCRLGFGSAHPRPAALLPPRLGPRP